MKLSLFQNPACASLPCEAFPDSQSGAGPATESWCILVIKSSHHSAIIFLSLTYTEFCREGNYIRSPFSSSECAVWHRPGTPWVLAWQTHEWDCGPLVQLANPESEWPVNWDFEVTTEPGEFYSGEALLLRAHFMSFTCWSTRPDVKCLRDVH